MNPNINLSNFMRLAALGEIARLRAELALRRGILRDQRRYSFGGDRRAAVSKVCEINKSKARVSAAGTELAEFILEHRQLVGDIPNCGRLCWHKFTGGQPIDTHYCQLKEGHDGDHCDTAGRWRDQLPRAPQVKATPRVIMAERAENVARYGDKWGERSGPSIIMYRDTCYHLPVRRGLSCLGCTHLQSDRVYNSPRCAHPEFIAKYEVPQAVATGCGKCRITPQSCPSMAEDQSWPTQPYECPRTGQGPEYFVPSSGVFSIFDKK